MSSDGGNGRASKAERYAALMAEARAASGAAPEEWPLGLPADVLTAPGRSFVNASARRPIFADEVGTGAEAVIVLSGGARILARLKRGDRGRAAGRALPPHADEYPHWLPTNERERHPKHKP